MGQQVSQVTDGTFEQDVLGADKPVLVDFWATWCPPCRMIAPTLDALAEKYEGSVAFFKLDIDENSAVPQRYGIKGIPTLIIFSEGREQERIVGASSREAIARIIDKYVGVTTAA
ncbi:MAG: thioredoxin [Acidobacteria bacterium]|nr:thioredoxin [Acidobacteriota bacterium]